MTQNKQLEQAIEELLTKFSNDNKVSVDKVRVVTSSVAGGVKKYHVTAFTSEQMVCRNCGTPLKAHTSLNPKVKSSSDTVLAYSCTLGHCRMNRVLLAADNTSATITDDGLDED